MIWVLGSVAAVIVIAIALATVGTAVGTLEQRDSPTVLLVEEAVAWIGDRLPDETAARISYEDVTTIVEWHLEWFETIGLAGEHRVDLATAEVVGDIDDDLVAAADESIDFVVARSVEADADLEAVDIVVVLDLQHRYLKTIGAFDETAEPDRP